MMLAPPSPLRWLARRHFSGGSGCSQTKLAEAIEGERRRIAAELHDGLQVQLLLLALEAQHIAESVEGEAAQRAAALRAGIDLAATTLRHAVEGFLPPLLTERGLRSAAQDLIDRLPVPCRLRMAVEDGALPRSVESAAYFVVAEAITNALKHARAGEVEVNVEMAGRSLVVEVNDDGIGGAGASEGNGLASLASRVGALGGWLHVTSPLGRGTRLRAVLPCVL